MNKKKAFITGIAGQDGSYLAELLLEKNYDVYGIVRRNSVPENQQSRLEPIRDKINVQYGDLLDLGSLEQASSSEMFGLTVDEDNFQRETTIMNPVSPYGCSKVFGFNMIRNYRRAYGLHATNGILFNHESPRRGSNFVTSKVVKAAIRIKLGVQKSLEIWILIETGVTLKIMSKQCI